MMLKTNSDALNELSKHFKVELQFNGHDVADFFVEGIQILVYGNPHQTKMILVAEVDSNIDLNSPKVLRELLQANHLGTGTGAASFSMDPTTGDLLLNQTLQLLDWSSEHLIAEVTTFIKYAIFWNSKIEDFIQLAPTSSCENHEAMPHILRV